MCAPFSLDFRRKKKDSQDSFLAFCSIRDKVKSSFIERSEK